MGNMHAVSGDQTYTTDNAILVHRCHSPFAITLRHLPFWTAILISTVVGEVHLVAHTLAFLTTAPFIKAKLEQSFKVQALNYVCVVL